ncbi:MAG: hypothetical protein DRQ59_15785 [Gammaproteobacteria bacterium]|nr:MAG: hypothetical protein DRQ59_15785 [Gammaproteobacteria bacterium]
MLRPKTGKQKFPAQPCIIGVREPGRTGWIRIVAGVLTPGPREPVDRVNPANILNMSDVSYIFIFPRSRMSCAVTTGMKPKK